VPVNPVHVREVFIFLVATHQLLEMFLNLESRGTGSEGKEVWRGLFLL